MKKPLPGSERTVAFGRFKLTKKLIKAFKNSKNIIQNHHGTVYSINIKTEYGILKGLSWFDSDYTCKFCGEEHLIYMLEDTLWEDLGLLKTDLVCLPCLVDLAKPYKFKKSDFPDGGVNKEIRSVL